MSESNGSERSVTVLGAGIVGICTALYLLLDGRRVTLIDRDGPGEGTSSGNAGIIATGSVSPIGTPGVIKKAPKMMLDPLAPLRVRWSYLPQIAPWLLRMLRASTPARMIELPVAEIETIIRPCGLSRNKSRAIWELSRILCERHQGAVPPSLEALEALPGIGHKSAQVVMAQDFGEATFPVDTHIHRLAYRWGLSNGRSVLQTERDLKRLFPEDRWNKLHLQIIFFGREHCPARNHAFSSCPLCRVVGRKSLLQEEARQARRTAKGRPGAGGRQARCRRTPPWSMADVRL